MKLPKLPKIAFPRRQKKLHATATSSRRAPAADEYYDDEPKTNLSSAFVVVLILHVVAVGGIYAFNSIKAARRGQEQPPTVAALAASTSPSLVAKSTASAAAPTETDRAFLEKPAPKTSAARMAPVSKTNVHRVQPGDNLTKVAAQHGVTVADLEDANGVKNSTGLRAGQTLTIPEINQSKPAPRTAASATADPQKAAFLAKDRSEPVATPAVNAAAKSKVKTYIVTKGDTATSIARKFDTTAEDLLKLNKIEDPKKLQLGQSLKLPAKKSN